MFQPAPAGGQDACLGAEIATRSIAEWDLRRLTPLRDRPSGFLPYGNSGLSPSQRLRDEDPIIDTTAGRDCGRRWQGLEGVEALCYRLIKDFEREVDLLLGDRDRRGDAEDAEAAAHDAGHHPEIEARAGDTLG